MRHPRIRLRALVALAITLIVLLSVFSDFRPRSTDRFGDLADGQAVRVQCEVASVSQSLKGWILFLFDFDGVVVRSEPLHKRTFLELLAPYNVEVSDERWYKEFAGTGSRHIFEVLVRELGIDEDVGSLVERRKKLYEGYLRDGALKAMPGVKPFLRSLRRKGLQISATSAFPDHCRYGETEIEAILSLKEASRADYLITTGKDAVKLAAHDGLPVDRYAAVLEIVILDPAVLETEIEKLL